MNGLFRLSWRHLQHQWVTTTILVACVAAAIFVPTATQVLIGGYQSELEARAKATPLLAGAKGGRSELTLSSLYFRVEDVDTVPAPELSALQKTGLGEPIPVNVRFTARGHPVVGTSPDYYEFRGLVPKKGTIPLQLGDVVLGADVAQELELGPGEALFSDQRELYDISRPPALKMSISGVLAKSGTPDDRAVFVDVKTCWILEGLYHGHVAAPDVDPKLVLARAEGSLTFSQALMEYNEVTPENIASFHYHGDPNLLPLTGIIVVPNDEKAGALLKARLNASAKLQMVRPAEVVDDLLKNVFKVKSFFDSLAIVLAIITTSLLALVMLLSMRLRSREMDTLNRIGCSRYAVFVLHATEILIVLILAAVVALLALWSSHAPLSELLRTL